MLSAWGFGAICMQLLFLFTKSQTDIKYMASLRSHTHKNFFGDNHFCDGIIIAPSTVITAAHCVMDKRKCLVPPWRIQVIAGTPNRHKPTSTTVSYLVRSIKIHPAFLENNTNNIALLYIKGQFPEDNEQIKILSITSKPIKNGENCETIGWGRFLENGSACAEPMNFTFPIELSSNCHKGQPNYADDMLCTTSPHEYDNILRNIESGGALICNGTLAGIVSWIISCDDQIIPRLFIDVYSSEKWITQNLNTSPKMRSCLVYVTVLLWCVI